MGEELGTGYQCHLCGNGEPSTQLGRRRTGPTGHLQSCLTAACLPTLWALLGSPSQPRACLALAPVEIALLPRVLGYVLGPRRSYYIDNSFPPPCSLMPTSLTEERIRDWWEQTA